MLDLTVVDRNVTIEMSATNLLPGELLFCPTVSVSLEEPRIAGMLLQRLSNLAQLDLNLVRDVPYIPNPTWR